MMRNDAGAEAVGLRYANRAARLLGTHAPEPFVRAPACHPYLGLLHACTRKICRAMI